MDTNAWIACYEESAIDAVRICIANPSLPVPSCPEWTGFDLAIHVGGNGALFATWIEREPALGPPDPTQQRADMDVPTDPAALVPWADKRIRAFVAKMRATSPQAPAWTFIPPPAAWVWMRRAAMEEAVHRWDAQGIAGVPVPIDAAVACDGVDEMVDGWIPALLSFGQVTPQRSLEVSASDVSRTWTLQGSDPETEAGRVSGPVSDLFLALWSRRSDNLHGDVEALASWAILASVF